MDHRLIEGLMEAIAPLIKTYVDDRIGKEIAPLQAKIAEVSTIQGEPGPAGKDADPEVIRQMVQDAVSQIEIKNGEDGTSVSPDDVRPMLEEMVAAIPVPKNGKDADPEAIRQMVQEAVSQIEIKNGEDGKSVTPDDVRPMLEEMVAAIPVPKNGKDADPAEVAALIVEDVAKMIPPPADGTSVSVDEVLPLLQEMVEKAVSAIPMPKDGADGKDGRDGPSIDEVKPLVSDLVEAGFEALPKLPASFMIDDTGNLVALYAGAETKSIGMVRGKDGARGASVMDGSVDNDGILHLRMSDGRNLQVGRVRGEDGKPGESIEGRPGRDALEIQILPGVDESRSYPEGVCARWRGGVIRSDRQTSPIMDGDIVSAGWSVLLEGIAEETEEMVDDRNLERRTVYTSGRTFVRTIKTASILHKGVWRESAFDKGDAVTYGGSVFIAQRDTSVSDKPGESDAWRLAVKRGRDGQKGRPAEPPAHKPVRI